MAAARRKRTLEERLRVLLNLKISVRDSRGRVVQRNLYTRKELSELLGVSVRTLRRFRNVPGHRLHPRTLERIRKPLVREETKARTYIRRKYKLPPTTMTQLPVVYTAKVTGQRTLEFNVEGWTRPEKIDFLREAALSRLYLAWRLKIRVPSGVGLSGDLDDLSAGRVEVNEGDTDEFIMAGPFAFGPRNLRKIAEEIAYHEDAGRVVVAIYLIERLPKQKKRKKS